MIQLNNQPKIIDYKNDNYYGIIFFNTKDIETFQSLSGMNGSYKKEYQFHFHAAVGRIETDGQILDIAIPLLLYNYEQEVGGSSVAFHLDNVFEAGEKYTKEAFEALSKLQKDSFFKELIDMGFNDWTITKFNNVHCHPSGVNNFSGTDYKKNYDNPGVCFPLKEGENEPIFSGIIQHKEDFAELIHMEYRIMNNDKNMNAIYEKGKCLTIIKGYTPPPKPIPEPRPQGPIDKIFEVIPPPPPPPKKEKKRNNYILKSELTKDEGNNISNELMTLWKKCNFKPIMKIDKNNIKLHTMKTKNIEEYNYGYSDNLFEYATHRNKKTKKKDSKKDYSKIKKDLESIGYDDKDLESMTYIEILELWELEQVEITYQKELKKNEEKVEKYESSFIDLASTLIEMEIVDQDKIMNYSLEDLQKIYDKQIKK